MTDARPQLSWAERFRGAMLGGAVGDALGAGVRHASAAEIHQWFGPQGVVDYLHGYGRRGAVTDLSQLTAFTLEAMLRAKAANPVSNGWLPKELVLANYLRWLHTQGVPWDHAMAAHLAAEPAPTGWLLGRPELYSTRNPDGSAIALLGRMARWSPVGPDGLVHPPTDVDGSAEYAVLAAPAMVWSNMPGVVYSTASAIAHIFTSGRNAVAAAGLHGDVLAQLIRGVPLWDAVAASDRDRLGTAFQGEVAADVRRTVHAAMFVGQRGARPSPADVDIEFDTENKPGELGIALAAVGSTRNFADALRVAVNHSSDSAVAGALAGQLAGAIHGVGGIPARWLDELELREIIEILCADATEAFAPPPPPQWAQRYVPNSRPGRRELTAPNTVEGAAEQTMILPPVQDDVDTPPQGQPQQSPRSANIGAPTFPAARADFATSDPSSTGPIPVPNLRSAEAPAETTAVLPAIGDAPQVGAFPPPNGARNAEPERIVVPSADDVAGAPEPTVPESAEAVAAASTSVVARERQVADPELDAAPAESDVDPEEADVDQEVAARIVRGAADAEAVADSEQVGELVAGQADPGQVAEPEVDVDPAESVSDVEPGEAAVDQEVAARIVRGADVGRIAVPDAEAVAAASVADSEQADEPGADQSDPGQEPELDAVPAESDVEPEEADVDQETAARIVRESADIGRVAVPGETPESNDDAASAESEGDQEIADRIVRASADIGRIAVPDAGAVAAASKRAEPEERAADRELAERMVRETADASRFAVPDVDEDPEPEAEPDESVAVAASSESVADSTPEDPEAAERPAPDVTSLSEDEDDAPAPAEEKAQVEREPVDLEPPARTPIDLEPAEPEQLADEPETPADAEPTGADSDAEPGQDDATTPEEPSSTTPEPAFPAPVAPPIVRGGHAKADGPGDSAPSLTERVLGCFLGGALGDSLGSDLEFITAEAITARFGPDGPSGLREAYGVHGAITDDTQMTLFTAEGLIRGSIANRMLGSDDPLPEVQLAYQRWLHTQGVEWEAAAGAFLADYPAPDGWLIEVPGLFATRAPGKTVWRALARFGDGGPAGSFTERINDSKGCGGVMRAAPAALWSTDPAEVFRLAARTAALTHSHPAGYHSAGALAVIVQQALLGRGLDDGVWLALQVLETWEDHEETTAALKAAVDLAEAGEPTPEEVAERLGGGWVGEEALAIAVCAALVGEDVEQALRIAVHHGGDSDSTGAICGNIVGALHGVAALPVDWLADLELRDVVEQAALDCVAEFGRDAFQPGPAAIEPPTSEDWNERYPVRPHWSAAPEPVAAAPGPEFPAPKPAPRRFTGVRHDELSEGEDE